MLQRLFSGLQFFDDAPFFVLILLIAQKAFVVQLR